MIFKCSVATLAMAMLCVFAAPAAADWHLMPVPSSIQGGQGRLPITPGFRIQIAGYTEPRLDAATARLSIRIAKLTGLTITPATTALTVNVKAASMAVQALDEDESYGLTVTPAGATLTAPNPLGALHGLETFYQLIENTPQGWAASAATIEDHPRFSWRGFMLDSSRHFMTLDVIRRNLDGMAAVKLNVFHWHLSDDQGFRVESKRYPKLQELGSDGLFYTQAEVRGIIEYAHERGIRVVPEFDIPGHSTSWLVGYPELAAAPGPYQIGRKWGVFDPVLDPANPKVYAFLDGFVGEMAQLFPDAYFHIGGDEVNGKQWNANRSDIPPFMRAHRLKNDHNLQAYFNRQILQILTRHGKRMEGWDEILNPALPKNIVIQSWRGMKSLDEAAREGYHGILSSGYYLDHIEPASKLYLVDPTSANGVLGGEVCMWAEYVSSENVDTRIWPRTAAIAERFWSPASVKDVPDMYRRLEIMDAELDRLGLQQNQAYRLLLERLAGSSDVAALKTLADVVDPGALGLRHRVHPDFDQNTPLNRFVDAARPDSAVARHFAELVDRKDPEARRWLELWASNDAKLRPLIDSRQVLGEARQVSELLSKIAAQALAGQSATPEMKAAQQPIGDVTLAVALAIARFAAVK
ncbi:MAG TPA: family 20 glycosylhydrolase [Bryobacteraceae bacterium]|jgi:hexosaminidase|nr:family 20 glycosylhydrolase [Bryobacteraceae bacterium]